MTFPTQIFITAEQAGRLVGVSARTIKRWTNAGLTFYAPAEKYLFKEKEVVNFVEQFKSQKK